MAASNQPPLDIDEDSVVSIKDIVDEEIQLQETANAVLGDSDDTNCTYNKGYVSRQALYACATCNPLPQSLPSSSSNATYGGGFCLACSLKCHEGHQLYELYTKRNFKCDCGNSLFPNSPCLLLPEKDSLNLSNKYNHNFNGLYCSCDRPYMGSEDEIEDDMIQCIICEDWFHTRHLQSTPPDNYAEMVCDLCMNQLSFLNSYKIHKVVPSEVSPNPSSSTCINEQEVNVCDTNDSDTRSKPEPCSKTDSDTHSKPEPCSKTDSDTHSKPEPCSKTDSNSSIVDTVQIEDKENSINTDNSSSIASNCILKEKFDENSSTTTGYFMSRWRAELCGCGTCVKLYEDHGVEFLTDENDTISAYEERAHDVKYLEEAGMDAMSSSMGRVQQVEMIHGYNSMKQDLYEFLKGFSENNKVVRSRDIEDFFGELQDRKRRRLESGEGIPPNSCH